jgi:hypothetical protein
MADHFVDTLLPNVQNFRHLFDREHRFKRYCVIGYCRFRQRCNAVFALRGSCSGHDCQAESNMLHSSQRIAAHVPITSSSIGSYTRRRDGEAGLVWYSSGITTL